MVLSTADAAVNKTYLVLSFFFFLFFFLGLHPRHMEVPRLGIESELQLPAYATATTLPGPLTLNLLSEARI